jgi:hypothetical protein
MAILLGRDLRTDEHVHHKDGNIWNNQPGNLQLLSARAHSILSRARWPVVRVCPCCRKFYRGNVNSVTCSYACSNRNRSLPGWVHGRKF